MVDGRARFAIATSPGFSCRTDFFSSCCSHLVTKSPTLGSLTPTLLSIFAHLNRNFCSPKPGSAECFAQFDLIKED